MLHEIDTVIVGGDASTLWPAPLSADQRGISSPVRGGFPPRRFMIFSNALQ